jgi:hypothetical protein
VEDQQGGQKDDPLRIDEDYVSRQRADHKEHRAGDENLSYREEKERLDVKPEVDRGQPCLISPGHELSGYQPEDDSRKDQRGDHQRTEQSPAQIIPFLYGRCEEDLIRVLLEVAKDRHAKERGHEYQSESREPYHQLRYIVWAVDENSPAQAVRPELPHTDGDERHGEPEGKIDVSGNLFETEFDLEEK